MAILEIFTPRKVLAIYGICFYVATNWLCCVCFCAQLHAWFYPCYIYLVLLRAETILSGVIIRPDPENPGNSSKMSVLLQNDVKGWIPHFIVNAFAAKAPVEWHDSLANYYSQFYSRKDKTEEGDSRKDKTEEGDSAQTGQSTGVAEGGESKGQSVDAEGGEGQVTSADVPPLVETTAEVKDESAETAGGADEEQGEAPAETEPVDEGTEKSAVEPPAESGPTEDEGTKPEVAAE